MRGKGGFPASRATAAARMWGERDDGPSHGDLHVGDTGCAVVVAHRRIHNGLNKTGRTGLLCLVTVEHTILCRGTGTSGRGRRTIVSIGPPDDGKRPGKPKTPAEGRRQPGSAGASSLRAPLLFRYLPAITFNSHRIHYDRKLCQHRSRNYPGLVGPTARFRRTAALQLRFRERNGGIPPTHFQLPQAKRRFSTMANFVLHAKGKNHGALSLWTAQTGRPIAMAAEARWA